MVFTFVALIVSDTKMNHTNTIGGFLVTLKLHDVLVVLALLDMNWRNSKSRRDSDYEARRCLTITIWTL